MRQSLWAKSAEIPDGSPPARPWLRLPLLVCQAAGGRARRAEPAAAAWVLLYAAAHLLDSIQDGDPPEAWWASLGAGPASNVATGLIATCAVLLHSARSEAVSSRLVAQDFFHTVLQMASAQHADLTSPVLPLQECWRLAEVKSGAFFGLACRSGARAAGIDESLVSHYSTFGVSLGLLVHIGDDLGDLATLANGQSGRGLLTLPLAYSLTIAEPAARQVLLQRTEGPGGHRLDPRSVELMEATGAELYLRTKVHQIRQRGLEALLSVAQASPARSELQALLASTP